LFWHASELNYNLNNILKVLQSVITNEKIVDRRNSSTLLVAEKPGRIEIKWHTLASGLR
jgi:hypothetical protein